MKNIFDLLVEPLGLPVNFITEWIILAIIGEIAYYMAFKLVGKMDIYGRGRMSITHWCLRFIIYIICWFLAKQGIKIYYFFRELL